MLVIKRQNGKSCYAYDPTMKPQSRTSSKYPQVTTLVPRVALCTSLVPIQKWYVVHKDIIDEIITGYVSRFHEYSMDNHQFFVHFDENRFAEQMIRKIYFSSQSRKKMFI
jgi:hypothetical protein